MIESKGAALQNAYENLRRNGAFDEVRLILKREKGTQRVTPFTEDCTYR